jgi:hypothetical protein
MTGPDQHRLAEELLIDARRAQEENDAARARRLAIAQVHATLALAAATAIGGDRGWNDVAGPGSAANGRARYGSGRNTVKP